MGQHPMKVPAMAASHMMTSHRKTTVGFMKIGIWDLIKKLVKKWPRAMSIAKDTPIYNYLVRFLTAIGINEFEDLEALATSFKGIVAMIGNEHSAITLMKLRNAKCTFDKAAHQGG